MFARLLALSSIVFMMSCASYKQNIMFKTGDGFVAEPFNKAMLEAERNYVIQANDILTLGVFTGKGERLIDPNPELSQLGQGVRSESSAIQYVVMHDGTVRFPMVGEIKLEGLTAHQAELVLQKEYSRYFSEPFVKLNFLNKRVTILGAPGGSVVLLQNENTRLTEVLALAKGLDNNSKAQNIRVLRNDKVYVVDFSSVEGYKTGNMIIEPGDVVYVEPIRRPLAEGLRDNTFLFTLITSLVAFVTIITR